MERQRRDSPVVSAARARMRGAGLRATAARIAVLACCDHAAGPLSQAEVAERLADRGFSPSTLFRSLTELSDAGLLRRLELGEGMRRYEARPCGAPPHFHFLCDECGRCLCLPGDTFPSSAHGELPADVGSIREVLLRGRCRDCATGFAAGRPA